MYAHSKYFYMPILIVALVFNSYAFPAFTIFSVNGAASPVVVCNIQTGVATGVGSGTCASVTATCNGSADDSAAFTSFNSWAVGTWQATHSGVIGLTWTGTCNIAGNTVLCGWNANLLCPFINIKQLLVFGTGTAGLKGQYISLAGMGIPQDNAHSARTVTANSGNTCVTLVTAANVSIFTAGLYVNMTGYDIQGLWQAAYGYPPNLHYFEYAKIASVNASQKCDGTSGASITFTAPLANSYKSTWPLYNSGNAFEVDSGGPATLYYLDPSWDASVEFRNLTIDGAGQVYAYGRNIIYRNVTFTGALCGIPTQNMAWAAINTSMLDCVIEIDKLIGNVTFTGGTVKGIDFQSSSVDSLLMNGTTVTSFLHGTPKAAVINNATISELSVGALLYGRSNSVSCTNCVISSFLGAGATSPFMSTLSATMAGGVITIPNTQNSQGWSVPGTNLFWVGDYNPEQGFTRVTDVTQDATNIYVATNLAGGFPPWPPNSNSLKLRAHPAPIFTCSNCTGSADVVDLSGATPATPLYTYSSRTYSPSSPGSLGTQLSWGTLNNITINVTAAYAGAGTATLNAAGQFHNFTVKADGSTFDYIPVINLKQAGLRTITAAGVTCDTGGGPVAGGCSGDSALTVPEAVWMDGLAPYMNSTTTGTPATVIVTIQTDQGVVNP